MRAISVFAILADAYGSKMVMGSAVQGGADNLSAEGVAVGRVKLFAIVHLQMGGQSEQKEAIYRGD
jgi:hypothetical protein